MTTANNGGFASVRSDTWGGYMAFHRSRGIRMSVQGDGRIYKLSAKNDDGFDDVMYQVTVDSASGKSGHSLPYLLCTVTYVYRHIAKIFFVFLSAIQTSNDSLNPNETVTHHHCMGLVHTCLTDPLHDSCRSMTSPPAMTGSGRPSTSPSPASNPTSVAGWCQGGHRCPAPRSGS